MHCDCNYNANRKKFNLISFSVKNLVTVFINQGFKHFKSKVAATHSGCLLHIFAFHISLGSSLLALSIQPTFYLDYYLFRLSL